MTSLVRVLIMTFLLGGCATTPLREGVAGSSQGLIATSSQERIAALRTQLLSNPSDAPTLVRLGREYASQAQWQLAIGAYREAVSANTADKATWDAFLGYGTAQAAIGSYRTALQHAQQALQIHQESDALNLHGIALSGLSNQEQARTAFEHAMAISPRDLDIRNNMALSLALSDDPSGYDLARDVAFTPNADIRHKRNFFLIAAILGQETRARSEGRSLQVADSVIEDIFKIGQSARIQGAEVFGLAVPVLRP